MQSEYWPPQDMDIWKYSEQVWWGEVVDSIAYMHSLNDGSTITAQTMLDQYPEIELRYRKGKRI
jgi:hypothetical protein